MMAGKWIPDAPAISREAIAVIVGAIIAAAVVSQFPPLKKWLSENRVW